jgi:hypothetical protein
VWHPSASADVVLVLTPRATAALGGQFRKGLDRFSGSLLAGPEQSDEGGDGDASEGRVRLLVRFVT